MKKLLCAFILVLTTLSHSASATEHPVIMRHTDNEITAFVTSQIDSITFSHYDMDSVFCSDIATQIIWTSDSIYRIPISEISKVQFQVPENKIRDGVISLENNLLEYITACQNDTVLILADNIPTQLLPEVGDRLVYDKMTELLPVGFIGEVISVEQDANGYICTCTPSSLTEVYENYFGSFQTATDFPIEDPNDIETYVHRAPPAVTDRTLTLADISGSVSLSGHLNPWDCEAIDISGGVEAGINITPRLRIRHTRIVEDRRVWESNLLFMYLDASASLTLSGQGSISKKFPIAKAGVNIPVAPFLRLESEGGIAIELSGKIGVEASTQQSLCFVAHTTYDNTRLLMPLRLEKFTGALTNPIFSPKVFGEVEFKIGGYVENGLAFITGDLAKVSLFHEGGLKITANVPFINEHWSNSDTTTDFYTDLTENSAISVAPYISWGWEGEALKGHIREKEEISVKFFPDLVANIPLFPKIGSSEFKYQAEDYGKFSASLDGFSLFTPKQWGAKVFLCADGQETSLNEDIRDYGKNMPLKYSTYLDMSKQESYRVYPALRLLNHTILADPAVDVAAEPNPVEPEMVEGEVYFTGEFRRYQGEQTIEGAVFASKTPAISLADYNINSDDVEQCRWEWRVEHPKQFLILGYKDFFFMDVNVSETIPSSVIYVPSSEDYTTKVRMFSNGIFEFYDNVFHLRLAVLLKSGEIIYPFESKKEFTYSYRPEMHFEDLICNVSDSGTFDMSVKAKWKGFRAICMELEYGKSKWTFNYITDNKFPIPNFNSSKLDYVQYQVGGYYHDEFSIGANIAYVNIGEGWNLEYVEFIDFSPVDKLGHKDPLLRLIQKNQPYVRWDVEKNIYTQKLTVVGTSYGLRPFSR